jgi:epoxyqueuosine reductase QueG
MRRRLQQLIDRLHREAAALHLTESFACRAFSDSAPVLETEFAVQSGVAWRGKHTLSLTRTGSWHFLGEIYSTLPLPPDRPIGDHCGDCRRCLDCCPTQAIVAPYEVDARLCISYLTIELQGAIPEVLRPLIGNRIYGCDDCQLCCPWNRFAGIGDPDFGVREGLDAAPLTTLFAWSEDTFNTRLAGSAIRRIGPPALAAQHRRRTRERRKLADKPRGAGFAAGRPLASAARTRRLGAGPACREKRTPWRRRALSDRPVRRSQGPRLRAAGNDALTCSGSLAHRRLRVPPSGCSASDP